MANVNKVMLIGNLTRDPELRYTPSGTAVADLGMAINRKYKDQEETTFVDLVVWGRGAEVICEYCKKGRPLFVEGRLTYDSWESQDGQKRSKLKVTVENFQFLGGRQRDASNAPPPRQQQASAGGPSGKPSQAPPPDEQYQIDDDIPF